MSRLSASLWSQPEPALAAAGEEGEWAVARVRLVAMALLLITPTIKLMREPQWDGVNFWGFIVTVAAAVVAVAIWWLLRERGWHPAIGFVSSALDVSLVSTALLMFVFVGTPLTALNSKVTFEIYFLAIVASSLRYDTRIALTAGFLATFQYAAIWAFTAWRFDLNDPVHVTDSGTYEPLDQLTRLILLGIAVLLASTLVRRAQRLLYLSSRDRLTSLYNRGHFDRALGLELVRAKRYGHPLALAILDVDRFKPINDQHGHTVGDRVLRVLAERLKSGLRRTDIVARYGGEEFVVLMTETTSAAAVERIESMRREISAVPIDLGNGSRQVINFSAGIAGARPADSAAAFMERADGRLLAAKRAGRGRTIGHG
jgi:diguanylate cyclase (GGDEF)-like protein